MNRSWLPILERAKELAIAFIARFGRAPTLRRLHYELVSDKSATAAGYRNVIDDYKALSSQTAHFRRRGAFPDLSEAGREILRAQHFDSAEDVRAHIREIFRVDRMAGQERSVCVVVEKLGSRDFLWDWFADYGVFVAATEGYDSQTQIDNIKRWQVRDGRPMIVLYAGDHDATGEDIDRDFQSRLGNHGIEVRRVALLPEHVAQYQLPQSPFDKDDSRAASFIARHGGLWQTELDALDPDDLRNLFEAAFEQIWDRSVYEERLAAEPRLLAEVFGQLEQSDN